MEVTLPTDSDGFISQECPSCKQQFKVLFGEGSEEPISHCPYCGYQGQNCWHTQDQLDYMQSVAANAVLGPQLKQLQSELRGMSGGLLKIDTKLDLPSPSAPPMEIDEDYDILRFACCNEAVKVKRHSRLFCIICGAEIDMSVSDSKKIFLSHKGVDKDLVLDVKKTLDLLGYAPWLDDDAMPAGTALERGLLKGMQDSCGVVFFITPSFKDQGYLETEINYAIQQKRSKGDKFAIITLQFIGNDGVEGVIPDLLKTYVWKKPRTNLEALREIVRALPISPGAIDWRTEITGVVTAPQIRSKTSELSVEAKNILLAAVEGDGHIMHVRHLNGEIIQANRKSLIPGNDRRIVAQWIGGLEDLQRRRFIKALGQKGQVFEVTREGYEAADQLKTTENKSTSI